MDKLPEIVGPSDADLNLFHMTHVGNLKSIFNSGYLYSNHAMRNGLASTCYEDGKCLDNARSERESGIPGLLLGDFVVFFYATRTKMLESIAAGRNAYATSEDDMVYLVSNVKKVRQYAQEKGVRWEASGRNCLSQSPAISADTLFKGADLAPSLPLDEITFAYPELQLPNERSKRMAEFHLVEKLPLSLIDYIAVRSEDVEAKVNAIVGESAKKIKVRPEWYFDFA